MNLKNAAVMAAKVQGFHGERKVVKKLFFVTVTTAALALGGCNKGNEDAVQNAELNQPESDINEIANQAAMDAANDQAALAANAQNAVQAENVAADNTVNPKEADEQNVSGM